jgi:hypothetical protein
MAMTYDDRNRPVGDPLLNRDRMGRKVPMTTGTWLVPGLVALALVFGAIYFMSGPSNRTTTASNNNGTITSTVPAPSATPVPAPAPAPTKTAP